MSRAQNALAAEELELLRHLMQANTELIARLAGQEINDVLQVGTYQFDASATPITFNWHVASGSVCVDNTSTHPITVTSYGPGGAGAPTTGQGVTVVPAGARRTVPTASRQVTLYGTANDSFSFQAYTAPVRPGTS